MKPRRSVVNTRRGPPSEIGDITVIQTLECGHELQYIGYAATKARSAQWRICPNCPEIDSGRISKQQRHRQSRAGNLSMHERKDFI